VQCRKKEHSGTRHSGRFLYGTIGAYKCSVVVVAVSAEYKMRKDI